MIISKLAGGLGNQMFQYAVGRTLSLKHKTNLMFDIRSFEHQSYTDAKRSFELSVFDVPGSIADKTVLGGLGEPNKYKLAINKYFHLEINPYPENFIKEVGHEYHPDILELPDNAYLSGYWQSEKYFKDIGKTIINDFSKRTSAISTKNATLKSEIKKSESVSLHVRRTDYVTNPNANSFHGTCDLAYYQSAMRYIEKKVQNPIYYVFSDDPDWTKQYIKGKYKMIYISHNLGRDAHEDLRLMSNCKHNIIANSSFSWWGAWLNQNSEKIVISPKSWFKDRSVNINDMILEEWVRL